MARSRRVLPEPPNGFIASAVALPAAVPNRARGQQAWMAQAWRYYDTIGELRFVANWVGNVMSRAVLRPVHQQDGAWVPVTDGPAVEVMDSYFTSDQGRAEMLQLTGIGLTVPGECYHVYFSNEDVWRVISSGNVTQVGKTLHVDVGGERTKLGPNDLVIRVWTPHPTDLWQADSPVQANLSTLAEIKRLNEHVAAQLDSRLAGAGLLMLPSEIQFPKPEGTDPADSEADVFMRVLGDAMITPIKDRGNASAVVPIVVTAPGDMLDKVQHLTFWSELDAAVVGMREAAVKRLALGLDTPPEVLLGVSDTNHWNVWMIDEASIKSHLEPRLQVVCNAVTTAYLRPALQGVVPDPDMYAVMADTANIRLRPNRSSEAISLYDRGELNGDALRRETGFGKLDAPDSDELRDWLLRKIATGSTSPEQTSAALELLGAGLGITPQDRNREPADHLRTDTRQVRREIRVDAPDLDRSGNTSSLIAACDALVYRALERAGNRLCNSRRRDKLAQVPPHERHVEVAAPLDGLLDGAWTHADDVLQPLVGDTGKVIAVLDFYVRGLITAQKPHDRETMSVLLHEIAV